MTTILASASAPTQSNALEDRHLIQTLVDANAQSQGLNVLVIKNMMMSHVSALVQIDHRDAPTIKHLIMILANAVVHTQSDVQEGKGLIQTSADVNVRSQGPSVSTLRNMTKSHVNAHASIDHRGAPILTLLITIPASANARTQSNVQEDKHLTQIPVDANALIQGPNVHVLNTMTMSRVSVLAPTDHRGAPTIRPMITTTANAVARTQ